jgi:hypothetical protein
MKTVKIKLFVSSVLTLTGRKKKYILGDMAYGEYLIYKDNYPKYYMYALDAPNIKEQAKGANIADYIESKLPMIEDGLTLKHRIYGIPLGELESEWLELKELPDVSPDL